MLPPVWDSLFSSGPNESPWSLQGLGAKLSKWTLRVGPGRALVAGGPFQALCSLSCSLAQEALCGAEMLSLRQEHLHRTPPSQLRPVCTQLTLRAGGCEFCHLRDLEPCIRL